MILFDLNCKIMQIFQKKCINFTIFSNKNQFYHFLEGVALMPSHIRPLARHRIE